MRGGATGVPSLYRGWIEGAFTGLGYATALASLSVFLVGSFRPQDLPMPYWADLGDFDPIRSASAASSWPPSASV